MEQGFSCSTLALQNTDILEGIRKKKTDVICNSVPLGCACCTLLHLTEFNHNNNHIYLTKAELQTLYIMKV